MSLMDLTGIVGLVVLVPLVVLLGYSVTALFRSLSRRPDPAKTQSDRARTEKAGADALGSMDLDDILGTRTDVLQLKDEVSRLRDEVSQIKHELAGASR